jgi:hypothetical protein
MQKQPTLFTCAEHHPAVLLLRCLLQWPSLLRTVSPTSPELPAMVQEKYRTCQTMCFCGVFPEIRRAWASVDNSLFLWRYDRRLAADAAEEKHPSACAAHLLPEQLAMWQLS